MKQLWNLFVILIAGVSLTTSLEAQSVTNLTEGVSGDIDKYRRNPVVTVTTRLNPKNVDLLIDAYVPNEDFTKYPIKFDVYINRMLRWSFIRSKELPGPVAATVGRDIATPPFNFAVVARLLHPNRTYTTVFTGSAFSKKLINSFDCTLTMQGVLESDSETYVVNNLKSTQLGNDTFSVAFENQKSVSGDTTATMTSQIKVASDGTASGSITVAQNGGSGQVLTVTGTATVSDSGELSSFNVATSDGNNTLACL
ncbi:MAG: hypothetical protein D6719_07805 [Candidatus Dadabacteria bacterium]|nr:MAG: hypothetical protein D6719_07805 [Candidatus Dadabacteria bacterium]